MPVDRVWFGVLLAAALGILVCARIVRAWLKYRGKRLVTCPENRRPAGVSVDSGHAALTALVKEPKLRLSTCSRWPERAGCGEQCLSQIQAAPADCLVRNILAKWYAGKSCVSCGRPFGEIEWTGAQPGLIRADKVSVEWTEVAPEELDETLATALPVCFACHMASTLVRNHPELVVDRTRPVER
jgi:hypothetical protein